MNPSEHNVDGVIVALATALERLTTRVTREFDPDSSEGTGIEDPTWAATHAEVVAVARECAAVLDHPAVVDTLVSA